MILTVQFELDESWDAYIPDNNEKLKNIVRPQLEGVKMAIVKTDINHINFVNSNRQSIKLQL